VAKCGNQPRLPTNTRKSSQTSLAGAVAERCGPPVAYGVMGVLVLSSALAAEIGRRRAAWRRTSLVDQH